MWLRPGTSDILLYSDVVVDQQYGRVEVPNVRAIVDCGANIGLTSAYLLCKYPEARLIAVEPDPVNYELCCRNLEQFGARATVLRAAVWGAPRALRVADPAALGTWASTVAPLDGDDDGQAVEGLDLPSLFQRFHIDRVDILKIDIEGAELDVLSASDTGWIDRVRCLAIELENAASEAAFFRVMRGRPFTFTQSRDAILALRREGGA